MEVAGALTGEDWWTAGTATWREQGEGGDGEDGDAGRVDGGDGEARTAWGWVDVGRVGAGMGRRRGRAARTARGGRD